MTLSVCWQNRDGMVRRRSRGHGKGDRLHTERHHADVHHATIALTKTHMGSLDILCIFI